MIKVVGDLILDRYVLGEINRISPEAPVPVLGVSRKFSVVGGAGNVANNLASLGVGTDVSGLVGEDAFGAELIGKLEGEGIVFSGLRSAKFPTIVKTRFVSQNQQVLRVDVEEKVAMKDFASHFWSSEIELDCDLLLISDYNKGVCQPEYLTRLIAKANAKNIRVLIDPKGVDWEKYRGAYLVKPNLKELSDVVGRQVENDSEQIEIFGRRVRERYNIENILITRSEAGMSLVNSHGVWHFDAEEVQVFDVSGAGDTVLAVLGYSLLREKNLEDAIRSSILAASKVISRFGTAVVDKSDFEEV